MKDKKNISKDNSLHIGENVQIGLQEGEPAYPTLLEDMLDDGQLVVSSPLYRGIHLPLWEGREVQFYFYRDNGRYCIFCRIDKIFKHNELRLLRLQPLSEPIKQQRRESFRLPINLDARIRSFESDVQSEEIADNEPTEDEWETTVTHNISETGVSIKSYQEFAPGDMVFICMQIETGHTVDQIDLMGIVRQSERVVVPRDISYRLGIEFMPYEESKRRNLAKFILKKQQIILKMKRNTYTF